MANDINTVVLVGRVTKDAELRYTASGTALCNFSLAVGRRVKKGDQWSDETSFFDLTLWDKKAENVNKYLAKGQQIIVQGSIIQERWEKDGQKNAKLKVQVEHVQLVGGKRDGSAPQQPPQGDDFDPNAYQDDIPF